MDIPLSELVYLYVFYCLFLIFICVRCIYVVFTNIPREPKLSKAIHGDLQTEHENISMISIVSTIPSVSSAVSIIEGRTVGKEHLDDIQHYTIAVTHEKDNVSEMVERFKIKEETKVKQVPVSEKGKQPILPSRIPITRRLKGKDISPLQNISVGPHFQSSPKLSLNELQDLKKATSSQMEEAYNGSIETKQIQRAESTLPTIFEESESEAENVSHHSKVEVYSRISDRIVFEEVPKADRKALEAKKRELPTTVKHFKCNKKNFGLSFRVIRYTLILYVMFLALLCLFGYCFLRSFI